MSASQLTEDGTLPSSVSGQPIQWHSLVPVPDTMVSMSGF